MIADFEDVLGGDDSETRVGGLEVVESLTHVSFRGEDEGGESVVGELDLAGKNEGVRGGEVSFGRAEGKKGTRRRRREEGRREKQTYILELAHLQQPLKNLRVGESSVTEDGASRLDGFDDLVGHVAGEGESSGVGVDLHRSSKGLLSSSGHAGRRRRCVLVSFVVPRER